MTDARDLLVAAIDDQRPIVLILGQSAWSSAKLHDSVLEQALNRLGRGGELPRGWPALPSSVRLPLEFYDWLAERFDTRVHPTSLMTVGELPWSAVFTSAIDKTLTSVFETCGRDPQAVLTATETPRVDRSRTRPPVYYLFGCAGSPDPIARPPADYNELNTRRVVHAARILGRVLDTTTTLGLVVVDSLVATQDWIRVDDILGSLGMAAPGQVLWFGGRPKLENEDAAVFDAAVDSGRILVDEETLATVVAELRAIGRMPEFTTAGSEEAGIVTIGQSEQIETTPEMRLRIGAVASIVDDSWTAFLPPLGSTSTQVAFRRFHGNLDSARFLVEGIRRNFAIERDFEVDVLRRVVRALEDHASVDLPIVIQGQSGTGKSVALARVISKVRENKLAAVLYSLNRVPQSHEITEFCELAEISSHLATLIVCDANRDIDSYRDLLMSLRSQGRRVVVLGSQ